MANFLVTDSIGISQKKDIESKYAYCLLAPWWSLFSAFLSLLKEVVV